MRFQRNALLTALLVACLAPLVVRDQYVLHLGVLLMFYVVLATSFNLVVGYVGEFPLGHMAFFGIGAYAAALLAVSWQVPIYLTIVVAGLAGGLAGLVIGAITLRLRGPFFVIITLAFAEVLRITANNWVGLTNGPMGISGVPQPAWIAAQGTAGVKISYYYIGLAIAVAALYVAFRFVNSNLGRGMIAVRENRFVAQSIGVSPYRYALLTFVIAAVMGGCAGAFYAYYFSFVGPDVFGFSFMVSMILMVLLGGKGTLVGPVVGALFVVLLSEYLRDAQQLRLSIFGLIVIVVVIFLPNGLMGFVHGFKERALPPTGKR